MVLALIAYKCVYYASQIDNFASTLIYRMLLLTGLASFLPLCEEATTARYWITFLVFSVFPAPDSPLGAEQSWNVQMHLISQDAASLPEVNLNIQLRYTLHTVCT